MKIIINSHAQSRVVPFCVNGKWLHIEVGVETTVPDDWKEVLIDAGIDFTVIDDASDTAPVEEPVASNPLLSVLDGRVSDVIAGLEGKTSDELNQLLAAEQAGKTRSTVVSAIEKALAEATSA